MKKMIGFAIVLATIIPFAGTLRAQAKDGKQPSFTSLFNARNLNGWYSFLPTKGRNNDPENVFTVHDGMLHISGKEFGYIATNKTYGNFHLAVEFKWGVKKYPPRDADTIKRDNGILFFVSPAAKDTVWPRSIECQVQEGDVGDIWLIGGATVIKEGKRSEPKDYNRIQKTADGEQPTGEWNRVEVIVKDRHIKYLVNSILVNEAEDANLGAGRIMIQSEGAEIYYRKIEIQTF